MHDKGILEIQPEFQREVVWHSPAQTRFIDSLIKQLPIPSMCFALDFKTQKWQVIDGLQRMTTIIRFLGNEPWRLSRLDDIDPRISGRPVADLSAKDSLLYPLYLRVENLSLPVTVIRCDFTNPSHSDYLFTIFHRLNAGGVRLNNQEIRNCIFSGPFNELLKALDRLPQWKLIKKRISGTTTRFRTVELILRFFAFLADGEAYAGNLARFLNNYMRSRRYSSEGELEALRAIFVETITLIVDKLLPLTTARFSYTVLETLLVGVGDNIETLSGEDSNAVLERFKRLLENESFSESELRSDIANKDKVLRRLEAARNIFG